MPRNIRTLRESAGIAVSPLRRAIGAARAASVPETQRTAGWLSVVMPARNVEAYLDQAISSVLGQDFWRIELIIVDDGSSDGTGRIVAEWAARDTRVRPVSVSFGDVNAARNRGIGLARGEFLAFLDGDDVLLAGAFRDHLASLVRSGSDFSVAAYDRLVDGQRTDPAFWIRDAHRVDRTGVDLVTVPELMVNAVQWSKVYRRAFWERAGLAFPEGGYFQDQFVSARAYSRARVFDVLARPTVAWRVRADGSSMTQQADAPEQIADRFRTCVGSVEVYRAEAGERIARERRIQVLSNDIAITASRIPALDDEGWRVLRDGLRDIAPPFDDGSVWDHVPAEFKVLYHLVVDDDRERALGYIARGGLDILRHELVEVDGAPYIALPYWDEREITVPVDRFRAAPRELRAFAQARQRAATG